MGLHDRIMNLRHELGDDEAWTKDECGAYNTGIEEAAKIAKAADELMAEMENAIDQLLGMYALKHCDEAMKSDECNYACEVLEEYNAWKDKIK